jgi:hypothetical protein
MGKNKRAADHIKRASERQAAKTAAAAARVRVSTYDKLQAAEKAAAKELAAAADAAKAAAAAARGARAADLKPRAINKFVYAVLALVAATAARGVALKAAADARGRGLKPDMFAGMAGGARAAAGAGAAVESAVSASAARPAAPALEAFGTTDPAAVAAMSEAPQPCENAVAVCGDSVAKKPHPSEAAPHGACTHASVMCQTQLRKI